MEKIQYTINSNMTWESSSTYKLLKKKAPLCSQMPWEQRMQKIPKPYTKGSQKQRHARGVISGDTGAGQLQPSRQWRNGRQRARTKTNRDAHWHWFWINEPTGQWLCDNSARNNLSAMDYWIDYKNKSQNFPAVMIIYT